MITIPTATIVAPTDFKIRLHCTDDSFDATKDFIAIKFFVDTEDCDYKVVSDPEHELFKNCKIDGGDLLVIFENYPFREGTLSYRMHLRNEDTDFIDDHADKYSTAAKTGITFVI